MLAAAPGRVRLSNPQQVSCTLVLSDARKQGSKFFRMSGLLLHCPAGLDPSQVPQPLAQHWMGEDLSCRTAIPEGWSDGRAA